MLRNGDTKAGWILSRLNDFPSLPRVVEKLLALPEAGASTRDFADLIALDQGLTAKVLRLVNSAFYSLRAPISSIRLASSVLGVRTLKSLALSVSVIHLQKRPHPDFDPVQSWRHALAVGMGARLIADRLKLPCQDEVYVAGLLHDIGVALILQHYPAEYAALLSQGAEGTPELLAMESDEFGESHPELGFNLASHWRLPALVGAGVRHHHTPLAELPPDLDPEARSLVEVVQLADSCARRSGYWFAEADRLDPRDPQTPAQGLGLGKTEVEELMGELRRSVSSLESHILSGNPERVKV